MMWVVGIGRRRELLGICYLECFSKMVVIVVDCSIRIRVFGEVFFLGIGEEDFGVEDVGVEVVCVEDIGLGSVKWDDFFYG